MFFFALLLSSLLNDIIMKTQGGSIMKKFLKSIVLVLVSVIVILQTGCFIKKHNTIDKSDKTQSAQIENKDNKTIPSYKDDITCFSRNYLLSREEQKLYDVIYYSMINGETSIAFSSLSGKFDSRDEMKEMLSNAVYSVIRDHPQLFMYSGAYTYEFASDLSMSSVVITPKTEMDFETAQKMQKEIDEVADKLILEIKDMDDYNKSKYIYTYIAQNTMYNNADNAHDMYGCLVEGISVCEGYSKAYSYIMQKCGIPVAYISGVADGELHAWNIVKIDGKWYHVDCTWGDPVIEIEDPSERQLYVDYAYLHLTTDNIKINHIIDDFYLNIPVCDSIEANYHVKEGVYLESYTEKSLINVIKNKINDAANLTEKMTISIKYATPGDVEKANAWLESGKIKETVNNVQYRTFSYSWSFSDVGTVIIELLFKI